jgi:hypothetical protein
MKKITLLFLAVSLFSVAKTNAQTSKKERAAHKTEKEQMVEPLITAAPISLNPVATGAVIQPNVKAVKAQSTKDIPTNTPIKKTDAKPTDSKIIKKVPPQNALMTAVPVN